jgi:fructokinase
MRIGVDLGGTKTEIIVLDRQGVQRYRKRVRTDTTSYDIMVRTICGLVHDAENTLGIKGTLGVGIPGTISAATGLVKNANTTKLNGHALDRDLSRILDRKVRCTNDANCLALSEAVDGAGAGYRLVFAAILGTGCGAGIAIDRKPLSGINLVAGEWGHNPLPWMSAGEYPGPACWCGKHSCIETWISGTGFAEDYNRNIFPGNKVSKVRIKGEQIIKLARSGDEEAHSTLLRYADRLARSLAHVINILDPDIIVLGGGMSNVDELYTLTPQKLPSYVFGKEVKTAIVRNSHGDSSGVRGAAWL